MPQPEKKEGCCHFCGSDHAEFCGGCQYHICFDCDWVPEIQGKHYVEAHQEPPLG